MHECYAMQILETKTKKKNKKKKKTKNKKQKQKQKQRTMVTRGRVMKHKDHVRKT